MRQLLGNKKKHWSFLTRFLIYVTQLKRMNTYVQYLIESWKKRDFCSICKV